ncbi:hypothetical protein HID58_071569 [Brassica napus]|uniref:Uncharacterized protein n=1 Tax=Brassica napus TaxID=3708 RepID=A0ABQ7Z244_BRANA|nr:hypothetical protein HID58_071569 [Brassica napus]
MMVRVDGLFFVFSSSSLRSSSMSLSIDGRSESCMKKGEAEIQRSQEESRRYLKETGHNMEHEWKRMILNWRLYIASVSCLRDKVTTDGIFVEAAQSSFWFCFRRVSTSQVIKKGVGQGSVKIRIIFKV